MEADNKFLELISHALTDSPLPEDKPINVLDFWLRKGYLTFAIHDYLRNNLNLNANVIGVEIRENLIQLCNSAAEKLDSTGLIFMHGDVRTFEPQSIDIMNALHACDTATDYAIHMGIRSNAQLLCAHLVVTNKFAHKCKAQ